MVIDDVSQARLGATNAAAGALTIELRPRNDSGLYGAVEFQEMPATTLAITSTLAISRSYAVVTPTIAMTGTLPYVSGYLFEDVNQNGRRDATEAGFAGVDVTISKDGVPFATVQTETDGAYKFEDLDPYTYTLVTNPVIPTGYTPDFEITEPITDVADQAGAPEPNTWPVEFTVDANGMTVLELTDAEAHVIIVDDLPHYDAEDFRVEPLLNFGFVPAYNAYLWTGTCTDLNEERHDLGVMINGRLETAIADVSLNPSGATDQLLGANYAVLIKTTGGDEIACGEVKVGSPTIFEDGRGSEFRFRMLLRLNDDNVGQADLLPSYTAEDGTRITSAAFGFLAPVASTGSFDDGLDFAITIDYDDPLNPFKHKYHPDHDNLDAQFIAIDTDAVPPHLWEVYQVRRDIELEFTDLPPLDNLTITETQALATSVGWGSEMWGGYYREVLKGLHKNDISVSGIFMIRKVLPTDQMAPQPYDPD